MIDQDFPGACILLDGALVVVHVSRAAQSMMRGDAVLTVRQQRVHARDDPHTLTRCLALAARGGRSAMTIARPGQAALTLRVEPRHAAEGRQVLVTLRDPDLEIPDPLLLQGLFGLTATEALVAVGLARGQTSAELAQGMGVQPNTVLSHIKRLLVKSGASRQSQLVSLILRSAAMPHPWSVGACTAQMGNDTVADGRHSASRHGRAPAAPAECRCHHERKHA